MKLKITQHAAQRLRQRRRNFKHRGLRGVKALHARVSERMEQGLVNTAPPAWYRGAGQDDARYVEVSPTLSAVVRKVKAGSWVCVTVVSREGRDKHIIAA